MASLIALANSMPSRALVPMEILINQGAPGGDLYVLQSGELAVERDGVEVARVSRPNSLVGEMSVLLGSPNSATVRAVGEASVQVIRDARKHLLADPEVTFQLAALVASCLDATTALLVDLSRENSGKAEHGLLSRILSVIQLPSDAEAVSRYDLFDPRSLLL